MNRIDLHVHTVASGHAMNTLYELAAEAKRRGLQAIAITDHGPAASGAPGNPYFHVLCTRVPDSINNVRVFKGIETNILDAQGRIDLSPDLTPLMDVVVAGMHPITDYRDQGEDGNTAAVISAIKANPAIDVLAHPVNTWYPIDVDAVAVAAVAQGVAIELNESVLARSELDRGRQQRLVKATIRHGGRFSIASDAHVASELGNDARIQALIKQLHIPPDIIVNRSLAAAEEFIAVRKSRKQV